MENRFLGSWEGLFLGWITGQFINFIINFPTNIFGYINLVFMIILIINFIRR